MAKCKHEGCGIEALFKSDFCWQHIQDKGEYKKRILELGKDGKINLMGTYLEGVNLKEANLQEANLAGAQLWEANLQTANLQRANLQRANFWAAKLCSANLQEADLRLANLQLANLQTANLQRANLREANLRGANLWLASAQEADLQGTELLESNLMWVDFREANLTNADLRNANLNNADLSEAILTGAKVWGMSHAGCKTENIKAEYLNFDKDGKESGIVYLNKEQVEEFFSSQPTIEILLRNKLPPYAIRTLLDLIDKINEQNPDWGVEPRQIASGSFFSELTVKASRDEILDRVANAILGAFDKRFQERLLEYLPDKKQIEGHDLILRKLEGIETAIQNPVQQITKIYSSGTVNVVNLGTKMRDINIFGPVGKMINVEGNYYEISAPQGREDLIRNLIDQLDSPEIEKRIKEAEAQLKGFSPKQGKFLEEQFRDSVEKIFKEKQKEVGFFEKVKAFSHRFSESTLSGVISNAIWFFIKKFGDCKTSDTNYIGVNGHKIVSSDC